jgi:hypothetical protein
MSPSLPPNFLQPVKHFVSLEMFQKRVPYPHVHPCLIYRNSERMQLVGIWSNITFMDKRYLRIEEVFFCIALDEKFPKELHELTMHVTALTET